MPDRATMLDGQITTRRYDILAVPAWLEQNRPHRIEGSLPTIRMFVDEETSIVTTNPIAFEAWIAARDV